MGNFIPMAAMTVLQSAQTQRQAKAQNRVYQEQAQQRINIIRRNQEIAARKRREQLRRAKATQMAKFGAQGVSSSSGSADALLKGLSSRSAQNAQDARSLSDLRIGEINNQLSRRRRPNLLELTDVGKKTAFDMLRKRLQNIPLLGG